MKRNVKYLLEWLYLDCDVECKYLIIIEIEGNKPIVSYIIENHVSIKYHPNTYPYYRLIMN